MNRKIINSIMYHAHQLTMQFQLQDADKEDVIQQLTLRALEAKEQYHSDMNASLTTYVKSAVCFKAIDISKSIRNAPRHANVGDILQAAEYDERHRHAKNPDEPYKPLTISTGEPLQYLTTDEHEHDLSLKVDIEGRLACLTSQQKQIVEMLEDGKTQSQIAQLMEITRQSVSQHIMAIRTIFNDLQIF